MTLKLGILIPILLLTSCAEVMGIKKWKPLTREQILVEARKYKINEVNLFYCDSQSFKTAYFSLKKSDKRLFKDLGQPLQLKFYDIKRDSQFIYLINCYLGGFPNIKWNRAGSLNFFPPKQGPIKRPDSLFSVKSNFAPLIPLENSSINNISNYDYLLMIHWSVFMGRQSKNLIKIAKKFVRNNADKSIEVVYVNMDNIY